MLSWPPISPNPQSIWASMGCTCNLQDLKDLLLMSWFQIPQDKFRGLDTSELIWLHNGGLYDTLVRWFLMLWLISVYIILSSCLSIQQPFCVILHNLISQLSFGSSLPWGIDSSLCIYEWTYVSLHASCKSLTIPPSFDRQSFKTGEPVLHNPSLTKFKLQVPTRLLLWHK